MGPKLKSIIINASRPAQTREFYSLLGLAFETKQISKGGQCHKAFLGPVELTLYEGRKAEPPKSFEVPYLQLAFEIAKLDEICARLAKIEYVQVLLDPTSLPDGNKAILLDPEGTAVELFEI